MLSLALLERRILVLTGHWLSVGRAVSIAYASNAMAQSLPIVGSGAATAFTYRRMVSHGAEPTLAGWTLTLAGVASNIAFVVILSIGGLVSGETLAIVAGGLGLVLSALVIAVGVIAVRRAAVRERVGRAAVWVLSRVQRLIHRPAGDAAGIVGATMADLTAFHLHRRDALHVTASAFRNWAFDLLCLAFSIKAAGANVPWWGIVLAWAAGSRRRQPEPDPGRPRRRRGRADRRPGRRRGAEHPGVDGRARVPGDHLLAGHRDRLADLLAAEPRASARRRGTGRGSGQENERLPAVPRTLTT